MALELIGNMLYSYLYEELRTKQQLGYHVVVFVLNHGPLRTVTIEIQSELCPIVLTQRIDSTLANFRKYINGVNVDEMTESAVSLKSGKFSSTAEEATHFWEKIYSGSYEFDIREKEAAVLQTITKEYLVEVWDIYFNPKTYTRVDLQTWVNPPSIDELQNGCISLNAHPAPDHLQTPDGRTIIDDVKQFQATQKVFDPPLMATKAIPKY
ncbi:hypothetical protein IWW40_002262 [Coemansia sp. RSA 1250]|nr:hypothetical protein IWW40_002262 [Coemansia sp. RSA 1250]